MNSISVLHTAVQARFYKSSKQLVDTCKHDLFHSADSLRLSELPRLTRGFWNNEPLAINVTRGSRGEFIPNHEEIADFIPLHVNREEGTPQSNVYRAVINILIIQTAFLSCLAPK